MERSPESFDFIIVETGRFSPAWVRDAVGATDTLYTREALSAYLDKLRPQGLLLVGFVGTDRSPAAEYYPIQVSRSLQEIEVPHGVFLLDNPTGHAGQSHLYFVASPTQAGLTKLTEQVDRITTTSSGTGGSTTPSTNDDLGSSSSSSSSSSTGSTSTSTSTTGSSGGDNLCDPDPNDDLCIACAKPQCCTVLDSCAQDPDCQCWIDCLAAQSVGVCYGQRSLPLGVGEQLFGCMSQGCATDGRL